MIAKSFRQLLLILLVLSTAAGGYAQQGFRVHSWISFEEGRLPERLTLGHFADDTTVSVVPVIGNSIFPLAASTGVSRLEIGKYALAWKPTREKMHLSIFAPDGLDRTRLGQTGAALYQADFYLPPEGQSIPNLSMLAQVLDASGKTTYRFYRFGILEPGGRVFFSYTNNEAAPRIFEPQPISDFNLTRPGWHRFQIIFRGTQEIYCAIDGVFTKFSPMIEPTLTNLNAGIMVTSATFDNIALTDNLSIQWTLDDSPLPLSPWTQPEINVEAANTTPLESGSSVVWLRDPAEAWNRATRQNRPILVNFYIPGIAPFERFKQAVPNTPEAYQMFNEYVLLQIDVNQLYGGKLAEKFQIVRLPTMIVLNSAGVEQRRMIAISGQTDWSDLQKFLRFTGAQ